MTETGIVTARRVGIKGAVSMSRIRDKIAEMNEKRGRPLTNLERFNNLKTALLRCDQCDNAIELIWIYCPWCGWQLQETQ